MPYSDLAAAVLAGGSSSRMGEDKAFLRLKDSFFIELVVKQMKEAAKRIVAVVGEKDPKRFQQVLGEGIQVIQDTYRLGNPMGGMLTAFEHLSRENEYVAVVACDLPFVKKEVIWRIYDKARGHDAAVPKWPNGNLEPLCAVYSAEKGLEVGKRLLERRMIGCKELVRSLKDVKYIPVEELRDVDSELMSFRNINTKEDFEALLKL
ncbi:MAG: molybdenum cofactor guanylyltransferase [Conexivisphaerales archaeon]